MVDFDPFDIEESVTTPGINSGELAKAKIEILNGKYSGRALEVDYNPSDINRQKPTNYGDMKGTGSGAIEKQFVNREPETFEVTLIYDTSETNDDVRQKTDELDVLVEVDSELHAPPLCLFIWGGGPNFRGHVESMQKKYTMFLESGVPCRGKVTLTIKEYESSDFHMARVRPESTDKTKAVTVREGMDLPSIARNHYGDESHWRTIANANDIYNPRDLTPGEDLELPPL